MTNCSIKLLGNTYDIKCPDGQEETLQRAAEKLNEQLAIQKKKHKHLDQFQVLILASLHISHELVICQRQQEHQRIQVTQFINALEHKAPQEPSCIHTGLDPQTD